MARSFRYNSDGSACEPVRWKGRRATKLSNDLVELIVLTGGGHLAEFRFAENSGTSSQNVLWEAPWETADPASSRYEQLCRAYGSSEASKFLAAYTGHALCLDYFGLPSGEKAAKGLPLHGETAVENWNVISSVDMSGAECQWTVELPVAQLNFQRTIRLGSRESVAYIEESVRNQRSVDYAHHWVQHATFGPPFLNPDESTVAVSGQRGITSPLGYEGCALLASSREFLWPYAPRETFDGFADLTQPFSARGRGFLAAVQLDRQRGVQYVLAINWRLRLGMGYCFLRTNFPWMTVWEENFVRQNQPWDGVAQVRGMEFGTTPLPAGSDESVCRGSLWDTSCWCVAPALGERTARYLAFLFTIPAGVDSVQDVAPKGDAIVFHSKDLRSSFFSIPAHGCEEFLWGNKRNGSGSVIVTR